MTAQTATVSPVVSNDSVDCTTDFIPDDPAQLSVLIESLQSDVRLLQSDMQLPADRLEKRVLELEETAKLLPQRLDNEITALEQKLEDARVNRDKRINAAIRKAEESRYNFLNLREVFRDKSEYLDKLLSRRKTMQNAHKIDRLRQLKEEIASIEASMQNGSIQ
jgi:hypothetical protein